MMATEIIQAGKNPKPRGLDVRVNGSVPHSAETLDAHIHINLKRNLPEFEIWQKRKRKRKFVIVGSGPSLMETIPKLRKMKAKGAHIYAVNSAFDTLRENGITPDVHYLLDASDQVLRFITKPCKDTEYLIASHCVPELFDRLKDYRITLYHADMGKTSNMMEILQKRDQDEGILGRIIPGLSTAAMRLFIVGMCRGYVEYHLFGIDSSYGENQTHVDRDEIDLLDTVQAGVWHEDKNEIYNCSLQMYIQAQDFQVFVNQFGLNTRLFVHGSGLIPSLWRRHYDTRSGRPKRERDLLERRFGQNDGQDSSCWGAGFRSSQTAGRAHQALS